MERDDMELCAVARIVKLRGQARPATFRAIAAALEAEGHRPKRGGRWDPRTVKAIWDRRETYRQFL